ncbi:hypothetical protein EKQ63_01625 (plasmid) [Bacillus sp. BD59S]|nr:hypothetical protein EKQ63_01625 [Bacillus sp. BD59S]TNP12957.1 hypothetical protein FHY73_25525 [Bacillus tropicus]
MTTLQRFEVLYRIIESQLYNYGCFHPLTHLLNYPLNENFIFLKLVILRNELIFLYDTFFN